MTIIRVIDFETTGMEPPAEVCEVGLCDLDLEAKRVAAPDWWFCGVKEMPPEVRAVQEPRLLPRCPLGKFRDKPWSEVEAGFLGWMLRQPTMEADLKWNAEREIERRSAGAKTA